ncbi:HD domain-containing protein [Haloimpatiens sp. FM7330]|uniref:HD domain-containing protein n=1 Tax=Haloimpatiens sp. FM7330 TaxID=3298610 RepID=UPI00363D01D9
MDCKLNVCKLNGVCINYMNNDINIKKPFKSVNQLISEMNKISIEEFKSIESITLNDYFFKNEEFLNKFINCTGGAGMHHHYKHGLLEHTLSVMYMAKHIAYRYNCKNKEIAILGAKLHDIGKILEYNLDENFTKTLRGEMEGHVVIGACMLEKAFNEESNIYSDDFKDRIRGCIVQHHGKYEYGAPVQPNTEEAFVVHFADYVDCKFNIIGEVKDKITDNTWSAYEQLLDTKLYK